MNSSRRYSKEREARITFPIVCFCNCVRSPICSLSPFPVCTFSTDLERLPLPECFLQPLTVPSLRVFNRPGTLTPVRVLSVVCHCSRSARFWQTWNAHPCQSASCSLSPFPVCAVSTDLERLPPPMCLWPPPEPDLLFRCAPSGLTCLSAKVIIIYLHGTFIAYSLKRRTNKKLFWKNSKQFLS